MEFTLLGAAALGVGTLYAVLRMQARESATPSSQLWDRAIGAAMAGLLVGRLAAMVSAGVNPLTHPGDIVIARAGVDTGWAALAALATFVFLARNGLLTASDGIGPAALAGLGAWHSGCLMRGACLGTPSELPWAVVLPGSTVTRHPTEIYAALLFFAVAALLIVLRRKRTHDGVVGTMALAAAGAIRLMTEPLRPTLSTGPVWWYAAAIVVGGTGAVVLLRARSPN